MENPENAALDPNGNAPAAQGPVETANTVEHRSLWQEVEDYAAKVGGTIESDLAAIVVRAKALL